MKLTQHLKDTLLRMHRRLPPDRQDEFVRRIRERLRHVQVDDLAGYTIIGALIGAIGEILPLDTVTGIDDWVEVGAALGATIGYSITGRERQARKEAEDAIIEEVQHALSETD